MDKHACRLRIEQREGTETYERLTCRDLRFFLNGVELHTMANFELSAGCDKGGLRLKLDLWVDQIEVDADVFSSLSKPSEPELTEEIAA